MKLLHSPFKYKITCSNCKSEISFKDEDISNRVFCVQKQVNLILSEDIKKAIINNSKEEYVSNYISNAEFINLRYRRFFSKIICPYCGNDNDVKTTNEKEHAIIDRYLLTDSNYNTITEIKEFSSIASYILYNKHLIPEDLKL